MTLLTLWMMLNCASLKSGECLVYSFFVNDSLKRLYLRLFARGQKDLMGVGDSFS